jgi:hypothetical protein
MLALGVPARLRKPREAAVSDAAVSDDAGAVPASPGAVEASNRAKR